MSKRKPCGYWQNEANVLAEAQRIMQENDLDELPSTEVLRAMGCSSLNNAISKYHCGFPVFRKRLGQKQVSKSRGYWQNEANVLAEAQRIMEEHSLDELPSAEKLVEMKYSSFSFAIINHHGGFREFRRKLGQDNVRKYKDYWKSGINALTEAEKLMRKHDLDEFPIGLKLREMGYSSLTMAISKYHGGMAEFRRKLNEHLGRPSTENHLESLLESYVYGGQDVQQ